MSKKIFILKLFYKKSLVFVVEKIYNFSFNGSQNESLNCWMEIESNLHRFMVMKNDQCHYLLATKGDL
jgi:hypothetical protein